MAKPMTDTALRALIAGWVRAALGELVEIESEQSTTASLQSLRGGGEDASPSCQSASRVSETLTLPLMHGDSRDDGVGSMTSLPEQRE